MSNIIQAIVVDANGIKKELTRVKYVNGVPTPHYYMLKDGEMLIFNGVDIAMRMAIAKWNGTTWEDISTGPNPISNVDLTLRRNRKKSEVGEACTAIIHSGISLGDDHYSLAEHDQIELMAQLSAVKEGATHVPYHADGEFCRMYPAEEFLTVANAAMAFIFYNRTYCNHLNGWIRRADINELDNIAYGVELPEDINNHMMQILSAAG